MKKKWRERKAEDKGKRDDWIGFVLYIKQLSHASSSPITGLLQGKQWYLLAPFLCVCACSDQLGRVPWSYISTYLALSLRLSLFLYHQVSKVGLSDDNNVPCCMYTDGPPAPSICLDSKCGYRDAFMEPTQAPICRQTNTTPVSKIWILWKGRRIHQHTLYIYAPVHRPTTIHHWYYTVNLHQNTLVHMLYWYMYPSAHRK